MHVLPYEIKRAHWRLSYFAIYEFQEMAEQLHVPELADMTPARYDVLTALWQRPAWVQRREDDVYEMSFGALVEKLGLHRSTVSKCAGTLVKMGFLTRHVSPHDARCRIFRMTQLGFDMLELARQTLFGRLDDAFFTANEAFATGAAWDEERLARPVGEYDIDNMLIGFGRATKECADELGSRAWPIYDPHFDDPSFPRLYCNAA